MQTFQNALCSILIGGVSRKNIREPSQAKLLTGCGDMRDVQFDVTLSVSDILL
jgi:hypothetical protein